jgi:dTDP-4-dehydrorhamnose 3,5-epimerase
MRVTLQPLPGVLVLDPPHSTDARGQFTKTYSAEAFEKLGLAFAPQECFQSTSHRGVLRGMHFQTPPHDHGKLVYCVHGRVLDVVLDLRRSEPTFGASAGVTLSAENRQVIFIPPGFAHGFLAEEDETQLVYLTSTGHVPASDAGVRWNSFGFNWGISVPLISARDAGFASFEAYPSPF